MGYKVVALVSGGKDSTLNMMRIADAGHEIVALGNLFPAPGDGDELDSFMYQTVAHEGICAIAECLDLPLFRAPLRPASSLNQARDLYYQTTEGDEVEDLFRLLSHIKDVMPDVTAVASGAILSNYQRRTRVEAVAMRLGLVSLSFLWMGDQRELLDEMIDAGLEAVLVKVACMGLYPDKHLGKTLGQMRATLHRLNDEFGSAVHVCGEGGEYESFTLDCPLYHRRIVVNEWETSPIEGDSMAPIANLRAAKLHLEDKPGRPPTVTPRPEP
ncbi:hypothetical protein T484DRAFT_1623346 [Baffinella frigidus]|nr:hypothetical protein T484DRAFT_1623346 [Cryptophyta sp. CCMP2293]